MAETFKDKVEDAGHNIADKASAIGHKVGEKVEEAAAWAKEKTHQAGHATGSPLSQSTGATGSTADIREHQEVFASCGTKVGTVDHVDGSHIKLTKNDSPDGKHHLIPLSWVAKVHDHVHLNKDHVEVQSQWQPA